MSEANAPTNPAMQPPQAPQPQPGPEPLWRRVLGATVLFAVYFGMCAALSNTGFASSMSRDFGASSIVIFFFFLMATFGVVSIAVDSGAAHPYRLLAGKIPIIGEGLYAERQEWNERARQWIMVPDWGLLACAMCAGMWVGTLLAAFGISVFKVGDGAGGVRDLFGHGVAGSAFCWALHSVLHRLGAYEN